MKLKLIILKPDCSSVTREPFIYSRNYKTIEAAVKAIKEWKELGYRIAVLPSILED